MISRFITAPVRRLFGRKTPALAPVQPPAPAPAASRPAATRPERFHLIEQSGQLDPLLAALRAMDDAFLDTEADNMNCYRTHLCLLQFLAGGEVYLVDALAPGLDLRSLWKVLAEKNLVMHGSDFDLRLLQDLCGFRAKSLFDTMLAAQLLNRPRTGLAPLLEEHFGVTLDKASQRANWSRRPFTPRLLDYAALDVWHLPALRDLLATELKALGRLGWLDQQCRRQIESATIGFPPQDELSWRIGQSERLRGAGLGVLHAVWHWREDWARKLNTPPFKVCANDRLIHLAFAAEDGAPAEAILADTHLGKRHPRLAPSLMAAVRDGLACDPASLPRRQRSERRHISPEEIARQDQLKAVRDRAAQRLNLDPTLIASRAQLGELARSPDSHAAVLLPWQAALMREEESRVAGA